MATTEKPRVPSDVEPVLPKPSPRPGRQTTEEMLGPSGPVSRAFLVGLAAFIVSAALLFFAQSIQLGWALLLLVVMLVAGALTWKRFRDVALAVVLAGIVWAHFAGWGISQVDPALLVRKAPDMQRILAQLVTPDIITQDENQIIVQNNNIAGADQPVTNGKPVSFTPDQPVTPNLVVNGQLSGEATGVDTYKPTFTVSSGTVGPGQEITISGTNWRPNAGGTIVWQFPGTNSFPKVIGSYTTDDKGSFSIKVTVPSDPAQVVTTFPNTVAVSQTWSVGNPHVSETAKLVLDRVVETIFLALMGTTLAIVLAIPISFLAARNLMAHGVIGNTVYLLARTVLNVLRAIEALILATVFVAAVGIGPFAGMLALTVHSVASLGKLYSEAIESIDPGPIEAITATGANRLQVIMYAVIPQFIPQFLSFTLYRWDINVRMSTLIGFVGGGGIGFILIQYINLLQWHAAGTAILAIAIVVIAMDYASSKLREAVI